MSYEKVQAYFESVGLGECVSVREEVGDTVEHAAAAIGCEPEQIAKTMSFTLDGIPILVVCAGDAKIDNAKFKAKFHKKATMMTWEKVETIIGHQPGAVCPFALNDGVKVYLDTSLKRFKDIHAAGGSLTSSVHLSLDELVVHSHMLEWVDVCKGWYINK